MDEARFNWNYRPKSYFGDNNWKDEVLWQIGGTIRRRCAESELLRTAVTTYEEFVSALIDGRLDPVMFRPQSIDEKMALGAIHPQLMGGEFLPDFEGNEVEIVNVSLKSVTGDVMSVRATLLDGNYRYTIVDEYENDFDFRPETSNEPLTFREVVDLIDSAVIEGLDLRNGLHDMGLWMNLEGASLDDLESLAGFVSVSSYFYPELSDYYQERSREMVNERLAELQNDLD